MKHFSKANQKIQVLSVLQKAQQYSHAAQRALQRIPEIVVFVAPALGFMAPWGFHMSTTRTPEKRHLSHSQGGKRQ